MLSKFEYYIIEQYNKDISLINDVKISKEMPSRDFSTISTGRKFYWKEEKTIWRKNLFKELVNLGQFYSKFLSNHNI